MVGSKAESEGIAKNGAKLVTAVSTAQVRGCCIRESDKQIDQGKNCGFNGVLLFEFLRDALP